jgi:prepilin-type N-terminal cleavage/methylation domain-containing protein
MKKLLNSRGFSLIEVTVAMGLMGVFVWGFMRLSDNIVETERKMMDLMEMNDYISRIRYVMNDTVACNKSLSTDKYQDGHRLPVNLNKLVDRRGKVVAEVGSKEGRIHVKDLRLQLEPIEGEPIVEEPRFVNLFLDLAGSSRLTANKVFKITLPVLLDSFPDKTPKFLYCDSLAGGVAQEMTNDIMRRLCDSLKVGYDELTGQCNMGSFAADNPLLKGDMFKQIQQMLKQQMGN